MRGPTPLLTGEAPSWQWRPTSPGHPAGGGAKCDLHLVVYFLHSRPQAVDDFGR